MNKEFRHYYPHADLTKFDISDKYGVSFDYKGMGYDVFKDKPSGELAGWLDTDVMQAMKKALGSRIPRPTEDGLRQVSSNFPMQFSVNTKAVYPHHLPFSSSPPDVGSFTNIKFYVDKGTYFTQTLPDPFVNILLTQRKDIAYAEWITGPNFKFWPQMLNFAVWCSTAGCGIGLDMLTDDRIGSFLRFHMAFTIRTLIQELQAPFITDITGGPVDPDNVPYDRSILDILKKQFKAADDFRYTYGRNAGYGDLWTDYLYDFHSKHQWKYFIPAKGKGLTIVGLGRLNSSIEAYVYCILGAQVNTRSSIVGSSGAAQQTRREFLKLFLSAVKETDVSVSLQRYQEAVMSAKARLDLAISPGCWLFPSKLILNKDHVAGYNNKLQRATKDIKFGINDINKEMHKKIPHFVSPPKKHLSGEVVGRQRSEEKPSELKGVKSTTLPQKISKSSQGSSADDRGLSQSDHEYLKMGLTVTAIALGYYIVR